MVSVYGVCLWVCVTATEKQHQQQQQANKKNFGPGFFHCALKDVYSSAFALLHAAAVPVEVTTTPLDTCTLHDITLHHITYTQSCTHITSGDHA
jgi:hypothetical protein